MALQKKSTTSVPFGLSTVANLPNLTTMKDDLGMTALTGVEVSAELTVNTMAKDESGEFVAHLVGDQKHTIKVDGHVSADDLPTLGMSITYGGRMGVTTSATISASNEDFVKASVSAEGYTSTGADTYTELG